MRHLLLSCSSTKNPAEGLLPASERYTGVAFGVLRNYVKAGGKAPRLWIISAKFGLISGDADIANYDLKMTKQIASTQLIDNTIRCQQVVALLEEPAEMGVFLGEVYGGSIGALEELLPKTKIVRFKGPIGKMLQQLKNWLYEIPPQPSAPENYKLF